MASTFKALTFFFAILALLTGGHARANDQAARVFDVTDYGAAPSSGDNRDVSASLIPSLFVFSQLKLCLL
jgi:galacturan 1,4-alpha-galacturonidase